MEYEILVIRLNPLIFLLREPILIARLMEQILYLRIQLCIIDFDELDRIGMKTQETMITCGIVQYFLIVARSGKRSGVREILRTARIRQTDTNHFTGDQIL